MNRLKKQQSRATSCLYSRYPSLGDSAHGRPRGKPSRHLQWGALLAIAGLTTFLLALGSFPGAVLFGGIGLLWALMGAVARYRTKREAEVAALMHGDIVSSVRPATHVDTTPRAAATQGRAPPMLLDVYQQAELPALTGSYRAPIDGERNIIGRAPIRILYLYNFFSVSSLAEKLKGNWRRFGPVFFLGSPSDVAVLRDFAPKYEADLAARIVTSAEAFDAHLTTATSVKAIPPGDEALQDISVLSGGYAQHSFLCSDRSWQHAVRRPLEDVDVVLLDASDYDAQRGGLNWEIGQLIDHVATSRFVVLADEDADQPALCAALRAAWGQMAERSPNNRPEAAPVRWVRMLPTGELVPPLEPAADVDPFGVYQKSGRLEQALLAAHYAKALLDDRILGLVLNPPMTAGARG